MARMPPFYVDALRTASFDLSLVDEAEQVIDLAIEQTRAEFSGLKHLDILVTLPRLLTPCECIFLRDLYASVGWGYVRIEPDAPNPQSMHVVLTVDAKPTFFAGHGIVSKATLYYASAALEDYGKELEKSLPFSLAELIEEHRTMRTMLDDRNAAYEADLVAARKRVEKTTLDSIQASLDEARAAFETQGD